MEKRPHRIRTIVPVGLLILGSLIAVGVVITYKIAKPSSTATSSINVVWRTQSTAFSAADQDDIDGALESALISTGSVSPGHAFGIANAQRQGTWAILSAYEAPSISATAIAADPLFVIANEQGSNWSTWTRGSPGFCSQLQQLPDSLLDQADKLSFLECYPNS